MSHSVAKILKMRPSDILDHWGVAELLVAFGQYMNEKSYKTFQEIEANNKQAKGKNRVPLPEPYAVKFMDVELIEDEIKEHS